MGYWLLFEPFECRVRLPVVFKCRVLVRSTLVAVIQRVSWVKVWPGERPGKRDAPQLTSVSSTCSTSTLTAASVYHAHFVYMKIYVYILFFFVPHGTTGLQQPLSVMNADPAYEAIRYVVHGPNPTQTIFGQQNTELANRAKMYPCKRNRVKRNKGRQKRNVCLTVSIVPRSSL